MRTGFPSGLRTVEIHRREKFQYQQANIYMVKSCINLMLLIIASILISQSIFTSKRKMNAPRAAPGRPVPQTKHILIQKFKADRGNGLAAIVGLL